jgi:glucose/arabinose dehydrogenase
MRWSSGSLLVVCVMAIGCEQPKKQFRTVPPSSGGLAGLGGTEPTGGTTGSGGGTGGSRTGGSTGTGGMATGGAGGTGGTVVVPPDAAVAVDAAADAAADAVPDATQDVAVDAGADVARDVAVVSPDVGPDVARDVAADLAPTPDVAPDTGPDGPTAATCTPGGARPILKKTLIAGGLARPIEIVAPPDEPDTLWVLEHRSGNVKVVKNGAVTGTLAHVTVAAAGGRSTSEEGLYSIALAPDYATSHLFYLFYSADDDPNYSTTVAEFYKNGATATFMRNVYQRPSSHWFHNGGSIAFHPIDKQLYISVGDNQGDGGPSYAQMGEGDWGRILKLNLSGGGTTMHYGLRNPWRFSFDAANGDLYIGDVGESGNNSEKVFYSQAGSAKTNFGWGGASRPPALDQTNAGTPIIGGIVYRGLKMPGLCGFYVYGRNSGGPIKTLKVVNGAATMVADSAINTSNLSSLGTDSAGELYFSELADGDIYRIDPN